MSKAATLKDVLYALEYQGAELIRHAQLSGRHTAAWSLEPGGVKVAPAIAEKARAMPEVMTSDQSKFGETRFIWRSAA